MGSRRKSSDVASIRRRSQLENYRLQFHKIFDLDGVSRAMWSIHGRANLRFDASVLQATDMETSVVIQIFRIPKRCCEVPYWLIFSGMFVKAGHCQEMRSGGCSIV